MADITLPLNQLLQNRYVITRVIGQGGFGITYEARDIKLNKKVCIKELFIAGHCSRAADYSVIAQDKDDFRFSDFVQGFMEEARQTAKFRHPGIVTVIDVFQEHAGAYMVMEFIEGETLKDRVLYKGAFSEQNALPLMLQLLEAVQLVHEKEMLHRDIKPENILINEFNKFVLIDFGSAPTVQEAMRNVQAAILTPGYAPPEQYHEGSKTGPFTDIYSIGATFYYMLTGKKPISAIDRKSKAIEAPHLLNPDISSQLSSIVMLAMELNPENRFRQVSEFRDALLLIQNRISTEIITSLPIVTEPLRDIKKTKSDTWIPWVLRVLAVAGILIGALLINRYLKEHSNRNPSTEEEQKTADKAEFPLPKKSPKNESQPSTEPLRIEYVESSGAQPPSYGLSYNAENAVDGDIKTFWGAKRDKDAKIWLTIQFNGLHFIEGLKLHVGAHRKMFWHTDLELLPVNLFYANARIKKAIFKFSEGEERTFTFDDIDKMQLIMFNSILTSSVTIIPLEWYPGNRWENDICIAEFIIIDAKMQ